ncbi:MAG: hypothetical protein HOI45_11680 [Rhodospirillaceae bacterium]|jgi:hypothetical protein|nr:hypothetical protein [Rhodospirillaceae bacterium]
MQKDNLSQILDGLTMPDFYPGLTGEGALVEQAGASLREVQAINAAFQSIVDDIDADVERSDVGKSRAIQTAAAETLSKVRQVELKLNDSIDKATSKARANAAKADPPDRAAEAVRQSEIRRLISEAVGMDGIAMQTLISEATETGDVESIAALVDAPLFWKQASLIPDHAALSATLIEMHDQRLGLEVGQFIAAGKEMATVFDNVRHRLEPVASPEQADNVRQLATGTDDA